MKPAVFKKEITVAASAIDLMKHVNNVQYLQWVQDVAEAHWKQAATAEQLEHFAWVALEHHIKYEAPAFENEILILETWVEKFESVKSIRRTKIYRKEDSKTMVNATTHWCLLTMPKARPARVTTEIIERF